MYYVRYVDPITGLSFDFKSDSLDEVVSAVKKAKDDFYFKGYSVPEPPKEDAVSDKPEPQVSQTEETLDTGRVPEETEIEIDEDDAYGYWF